MVHHTVSLELGSKEPQVQEMKTVVFNYPKDFKGPRHFKDGSEKTIAKETAEQFISLGIASEKESIKVEPTKSDTVSKPQKTKK